MAVRASDITEVLRTDDLRLRVRRPADYAGESRELLELAQALTANPREILDRLVTSALHLCSAGSTGISILDSETGGDSNEFRWRALAGAWAGKYLGATLPRNHSPCGVVLSRNSVQLMTNPAIYYDYVANIEPPCLEVLLVPFYSGSEPIGTIWAVIHEKNKHFDAEDERLLSSLATFASAGYQTLKVIETLEIYGQSQSTAVKALADANRLREEHIATIAHELRNPLDPIRNSALILLRQSNDPIMVRRAAQVIDRQSSMMTRLINDLLDVSRVRLGVLELHRSQVNLADVLRSALDASLLAPAVSSHAVTVSVPNEALCVEGDAERLSQIFVNLMNNAAKYTDARGAVSIRLTSEGSNAVISFTDTGIGISSDKIESIFDLFAQAGQAGSARSGGGLGIGLHLAQQLVEAHGGKLRAASSGPGCGATFTVELPLR